MAVADYSRENYYQNAIASIDLVQKLANGGIANLNTFQCQYLSRKLTETGNFLQVRKESLISLPNIHDIRRVALLELLYVVKLAEKLVRHCCCDTQLSWLQGAVSLPEMKEDIIDILLDLRWWTSMLEIAVALVTCESSSQQIELETKLLRRAEEELQRLWSTLYFGNDLQEAVMRDTDPFRSKLVEVRSSYAGRSENAQDVVNYLLLVYLESRLEKLEQDIPELNAYDDFKVIGQGSFGTVSKVKWLGRECALKIPKSLCKAEATILSQFHHPHIVQFLHYWEAPYQAEPGHSLQSHILMELMPRDLQNHMVALIKKSSSSRNKVNPMRRSEQTPILPFSELVAIDIALQVAKAMWHLHNNNVAHRDLKPGNLLVKKLNEYGIHEVGELATQGYLRVKLADFGIAKAQAMSSTFSPQSAKRGATLYGAPEVFANEELSKVVLSSKKFPRKADVWSFAIILCEILSGKQPFEGEVFGDLHGRIVKGLRPRMPEGCPGYLKFCISSCWELDPENRPDFRDILRMLRLAKCRSLGIIKNDYDLFTYTTKKNLVKCLRSPGMTLAIQKQPRPKTNVIWFLFLRSALNLVKRRYSRPKFNPNIKSTQGVPQFERKTLPHVVNQIWPKEGSIGPSDAYLDVIFFEGNVGKEKALSSVGTWVQRGNTNVWWPRDWLPRDFGGNIRVLLLQYNIEKGLKGVVEELEENLVFRDFHNRDHTWCRPIVLVGHSLGCCIIESLVVELDRKARQSVESEDKRRMAEISGAFMRSLAGCFFYSPPENGFVLRSASDANLLKNVFGGLNYSETLFQDWCVGSPTLTELSKAFVGSIQKRPVAALVEGCHTEGRMVVPKDSMKTEGFKRVVLEDSDHASVCKPTDINHKAYQELKDFCTVVSGTLPK